VCGWLEGNALDGTVVQQGGNDQVIRKVTPLRRGRLGEFLERVGKY